MRTISRAGPRVNRRDVLRVAGLAALGGLGLAGCGSSFAGGVAGTAPAANTLAYWNLFGGGDGEHMIMMENAYSKAHPKIDLRAVTLAWGNPYYTKLALATLGDQPPDVAISHLTRASTLANAGLLEELNEQELAPFGLTGNNFTAAAWKKAHTNGKLYAIPLDTHPFVMFYNTEVCKKAGLLDKDGKLKNLDGPTALLDAMAAAKKVTGKWGGVISINNDTATQWRWFSTMFWQLGGQVIADDGTKIVMDDAKAEKVLSYISDAIGTKKLMPANIDYGGATTVFASGQAGFYFEGEWEVSTFITSKTPFNMTGYPNVFGGKNGYACQADSHSFVLPVDPKRDSKRRALCFQFIRYMLGQSKTWAEGGHIPAWLPFQHSAAYKALKPQSNYAYVANYAHYDEPAWYSGSGSDFENITGSAIAAVSGGLTTPAQAVAEMRSNLTKYANTPNPV